MPVGYATADDPASQQHTGSEARIGTADPGAANAFGVTSDRPVPDDEAGARGSRRPLLLAPGPGCQQLPKYRREHLTSA
jgi:hypothetical protein